MIKNKCYILIMISPIVDTGLTNSPLQSQAVRRDINQHIAEQIESMKRVYNIRNLKRIQELEKRSKEYIQKINDEIEKMRDSSENIF